MNYLAHAYLSFGHPDILAGNMISDYVKGNKKFDYTEAVQQGIMLHRMIDTFTDNHDATARAKEVFKASVGLYAGAFVDVAYDHFLAKDAGIFNSGEDLLNFSHSTYHTLAPYQPVMPQRFASMFPYMRQQNWLYNYQFTWAISNSFEGVVRRAAYLNESAGAFDAFLKEYDELQACYNSFFPQVKNYVLASLASFGL
ncbi:acyl carrier protein phosphodiesterase [Foetidibacter luteolus]|uniref:acyl carrier protein phosphodiesterase n=1 Tax=Foetidibacter luteolus TaxID=2608880 RepID=UPI00129B5C68|nr:ACP phosphodiesterase [Foetidibacter luteolus]